MVYVAWQWKWYFDMKSLEYHKNKSVLTAFFSQQCPTMDFCPWSYMKTWIAYVKTTLSITERLTENQFIATNNYLRYNGREIFFESVVNWRRRLSKGKYSWAATIQILICSTSFLDNIWRSNKTEENSWSLHVTCNLCMHLCTLNNSWKVFLVKRITVFFFFLIF